MKKLVIIIHLFFLSSLVFSQSKDEVQMKVYYMSKFVEYEGGGVLMDEKVLEVGKFIAVGMR